VLGYDRDPGADDEDHEEHVQEVLPAHPCRNPHGSVTRQLRHAGITVHEILHRGEPSYPFGDGDPDQQYEKSDRDQPE